MKLEALGWNRFFESQVTAEERKRHYPARVSEEQRGGHRLVTEIGEFKAEVSGKLRYRAGARADLPAVGDWVVADIRGAERRATIHRILDRRSKVSRKVAGRGTSEQILATNVDTVLLVTSLNRDLSLRRIERYLTMIWESGASPVVLLNKADLCYHVEGFVRLVDSVACRTPVHVISALHSTGLEDLASYFEMGRTSVLIGSSGVGKSTLINRLLKEDILSVQEIRASDDRGRHNTTSRQLLFLPGGGMIIDTPGLRELQPYDSEEGVERAFEDLEMLAEQCRFRDCQHDSEPGCAVRQASTEGRLDAERLGNYMNLKRELRYLARKGDVLARIAERKKWKKVHKAIRRLDKWK